MNSWLKDIGIAVLIGILWAMAWAFVGMVIEAFEPDPSFIDVWPPALAAPALLTGIVFCVLVATAERGRKLRHVSVPRSIVWGAVSGIIVGLIPPAMVVSGFADTDESLISLAAVLVAASVGISTISAALSVLYARHYGRMEDAL